jgi:glucose-6-phosphate isomerase
MTLIKFDYKNAFFPHNKGGLQQDIYNNLTEKSKEVYLYLQNAYTNNVLPLLNVTEKIDDLVHIQKVVNIISVGAEYYILLGTGGSSLGAMALAQLAGFDLPIPSFGKKPKFYAFDNLDAQSMEYALNHLPLEKTRFIIVSKSGTTLETMSQAFVVVEALEKANLKNRLHELIVVITEKKDTPLYRFAQQYQLPFLEHAPDIGGRFAVLTVVGMLPAMLMGLDAYKIRQGALAVINQFLNESEFYKNIEAIKGACYLIGLEQQKNPLAAHIFIAYGDRYERFGAWARQLWAESLGKDNKGVLFVPAVCPVDQHSQLQLYLGGVNDKSYTVLTENVAGKGNKITQKHDKDFVYLENKTIGDIIDAEQRAIVDVLAANERPVRVISNNQLDEETIGALFMHFMLETIVSANLTNVDAFSQPAVEEGKIRTRAYLQNG